MKKTTLLLLFSGIMILSSCKKEQTTVKIGSGISKEAIKTDYANQESQQTKAYDGPITEMTFEKTTHDFGDIKPESKVDYTFAFTNSGKENLVITNAQGSCGCTVPEYPKEAIKPGEKGEIKVSFNSAGKSGKQEKTVTLFANTETGNKILTIKGLIK